MALKDYERTVDFEGARYFLDSAMECEKCKKKRSILSAGSDVNRDDGEEMRRIVVLDCHTIECQNKNGISTVEAYCSFKGERWVMMEFSATACIG